MTPDEARAAWLAVLREGWWCTDDCPFLDRSIQYVDYGSARVPMHQRECECTVPSECPGVVARAEEEAWTPL